MLAKDEYEIMTALAHEWEAEAYRLIEADSLSAAQKYTDYLWGAYCILVAIDANGNLDFSLRHQLLHANIELDKKLRALQDAKLAEI